MRHVGCYGNVKAHSFSYKADSITKQDARYSLNHSRLAQVTRASRDDLSCNSEFNIYTTQQHVGSAFHHSIIKAV